MSARHNDHPEDAMTREWALEEAARVVERWSLPTIQTPSMWLVDKAGIAAEIRALASAQQEPAPAAEAEEVARVRHVKRGSTYRIIGKAQVQCEKDDPLTDYEVVVVYRCEQDGEIWVRRVSEFDDGRFEKLPAARAKSGEKGRTR